MARVIDKLPELVRTPGGSKYPIAEWLDGRVWVLLKGEDFRCGVPGIRSALGKAAARRGGMLETRTLREGDEVIGVAVQFVPISGAPRPASSNTYGSLDDATR